jgi:hypothetical protein
MNIALKLETQKAPGTCSSLLLWALDAMMMNFFRRFPPFNTLDSFFVSSAASPRMTFIILDCEALEKVFFFSPSRPEAVFSVGCCNFLQRPAQGRLSGAAVKRREQTIPPSASLSTMARSYTFHHCHCRLSPLQNPRKRFRTERRERERRLQQLSSN